EKVRLPSNAKTSLHSPNSRPRSAWERPGPLAVLRFNKALMRAFFFRAASRSTGPNEQTEGGRMNESPRPLWVKSGHWNSVVEYPLCGISGCEQVHQIAPIQSASSLHQFSEDYDCER